MMRDIFGNIKTALSRRRERRASLRGGVGSWLYNALSAGPTASGAPVNEASALTFSAVYSAVRILADGVASLPLTLYRREDDGDRHREESNLSRLLGQRPSSDLTSFTWRRAMMSHALLWGNAVSQISRSGGVPSALWPIEPWRVRLERDASGALLYSVDGGAVRLKSADVVHIAAFGTNPSGWGISPIQMARESIGHALSAERFGGSFFGNASRPSGILEYPHKLDDERRQQLAAQWKAANSGPSNTGSTVILESGMTWRQTSIPNTDAQFLESRNFQLSEIARFYRIPSHMLALNDRATFASVKEQQRSFYVDSLRPWLVQWEQELERKLLPGNGSLYFEFDVGAMLRSDARERWEVHRIAHDAGLKTKNEIRLEENLPRIDGGDVPIQPLNIAPLPLPSLAAAEAPAAAIDELQARAADVSAARDAGRGNVRAALRSVLVGALMRGLSLERNSMARQVGSRLRARGDVDGFRNYCDQYYGKTLPGLVGPIVTGALEAFALGGVIDPAVVVDLSENVCLSVCRRSRREVDDLLVECGEKAAVAADVLGGHFRDRKDGAACELEADALFSAIDFGSENSTG